jgi:C4-dicarboxylate-specific signal transduction histidine kinase
MFASKPQERRTIEIGFLVDQALALTQGELETNRTVVKSNASGDRSVVLANRVQLQQVLVNLIMNAIEAMGSVKEQKHC